MLFCLMTVVLDSGNRCNNLQRRKRSKKVWTKKTQQQQNSLCKICIGLHPTEGSILIDMRLTWPKILVLCQLMYCYCDTIAFGFSIALAVTKRSLAYPTLPKR